ncbi:MAG TPA: DUF2889 domain-containing protein [Acidimicrobiales bacterium]|nr:DUF2889 domain-containing protein [Acidimicrobiales bacterium]
MDRSIPAALQRPVAESPARPSPSARRTSHVDIVPDERGDGNLVLSGQVRDLVTSADGGTAIAGEARVRAELGAGRRLEAIDATPWLPELGGLLGRPVAAGFRSAVDELVPGEHLARSPLALMLDDLPVAALIAGYADLYVRSENPRGDDEGPTRAGSLKSDICSGWRTGGTMLTLTAEQGFLPVPVGPVAPRLERAGDPFSWHEVGPSLPGSMRRRRLIDVSPGDLLTVFAMFRDTYTDPAGTETVLHEYTIDLTVDPVSLEVRAGSATPRNLPWTECPSAALSAGRIVGHRTDELSDLVRADFRGISTCTHLNDLVRSLTGVGALARLL